MNDYLHIIVNAIVLAIGVMLWLSCREIERKIKNDEVTYSDLIYKLHLILEVSEYDVFKIAAREKGWPEYTVEAAFKRYCQDGSIPPYLKEFIDEGKDAIIGCSIKTWIW